jgi:hypothetical protein
MPNSSLFNRVMFIAATSGLADFIVGQLVAGYDTPATRGVTNGTTVSYTAQSGDLSQWETGQGTYQSGSSTITRTTIRESSSGGAKVSFNSLPLVFLDALAQDLSGGGGAVSSVFGRTGAVVAATNDYSFSQISGSVAASQLPNPSATTLGGIESFAAQSSKWINAISTLGVPSATQPAFTDISGTVAASQLPNPSATTLGGIESLAAVGSKWINTISTSGVPSATQPNFTDLAGSIAGGQIPNSTVTLAMMANETANTILGNNTGSPATPIALSQAQVTAMLNVFTSGLQGLVPSSGGGTTNFLRADGTFAAPAAGVSGSGASGQVAYWNGTTSLTGDAGLTYTAPGQLTHALGTITTNNKAVNITGTWNASGITFDAPLFMNIVNTASAVASMLFDFQIGGNSQFILQPNAGSPILSLGGSATNSTTLSLYSTVDTLSNPTNYLRMRAAWGGTGAATFIFTAENGGTGLAPGGYQFWVGANNKFSITASNGCNCVGNFDIAQFGGGSGPHLTSPINGGILGIGTIGGGSTDGWINWGGEARVTSDQTFTSTTTLANVSGLSVTLLAGRTYSFVAEISWTDAAAGGLQLAIGGTATVTNIIYDGYIIDSGANGIKGNAQATALGTAVASSTTTGTAGHARIAGTITVNAAGTLTVQAAQNTSNGTATTIKRGSTFIVQDMP